MGHEMERKKAIIQLRRGSKAEFESANPVLENGEPGVITQGPGAGGIKVGDGATHWNDLPYSGGIDAGPPFQFRIDIVHGFSDGGVIAGYIDFTVYNDYCLGYQFYMEKIEVGSGGDPLVHIAEDEFFWLASIEEYNFADERVPVIIQGSAVMPWDTVRYAPPQGFCEIVDSINNYHVSIGSSKLMYHEEPIGDCSPGYSLWVQSGKDVEGNIIVGSGMINKYNTLV